MNDPFHGFPERLITRQELRQITGNCYSDVHFLRLEQAGKFPRRLKLNQNRVVWRLSEVLEWIEARSAERG